MAACLLKVLVLAAFSGLITSQTTQPTASPTTRTNDPWSGCVDPSNPGKKEILKIGSPSTICITLGPGGNWAQGAKYGRYTFRPKADEYSRFHIPKSYDQLIGNETSQFASPFVGNVTIHAAAQDKLSFLRVFYDPVAFRVYPFLTAVVDATNGVVNGVAWDDACVFCNKNRCLENMYNFDGVSAKDLGINSPSKGCYFTQEECNKIHATGGTECDLTIYVVWTGTDHGGKTFQSSGKRFSAFPPARLQDQLLNQLPSFSDLNPFR